MPCVTGTATVPGHGGPRLTTALMWPTKGRSETDQAQTMQTLIISRTGLFYSALATYIRDAAPCTWIQVSHEPPPAGPENPWLLFEALSDKIDASISGDVGEARNLHHIVAIADFLDLPDALGSLDFAQEVGSGWREVWPAAFSMLALAYPDIHWVVMVRGAADHRSSQVFDKLLTTFHVCQADALNNLDALLSLHPVGFSPLFDPGGFREHLKRRYYEDNAAPWPLRHGLCLAIDEERTYALMHAYSAYNNGLRALPVTSLSFMETLLRPPALLESYDPFTLTIEDLNLEFPDENNRELHLESLATREEYFQAIKHAEQRVLVTTGDLVPEEKDGRKVPQRLTVRFGCHVPPTLGKPTGGVYELRDKMRDLGVGSVRRKRKPGTTNDHSAPSRALAVATRLLDRARCLLSASTTVADALTGATLALDAQQLLLNLTPITALEALQIRHDLEVVAESMFCGIRFNFTVDSRIKDLENDVEHIVESFPQERREVAFLNACSHISHALAKRFREFNQFDEELECMIAVRRHHRALGPAQRHPNIDRSRRELRLWTWLRYGAWKVGQGIRWYLDRLLDSLGVMSVALFGWPLVFGLLFYCLGFKSDSFAGLRHLYGELAFSYSTFFSLGTVAAGEKLLEPSWGGILAIAEIGWAFLHLSVFISSLYARLARR